MVVDVALDLWANPEQQQQDEEEDEEDGARVTVMEHWDIVQRDMFCQRQEKDRRKS